MRVTGLWWWIDRWRKSTAYMDMTLEEQGAYRNLLDEASLRGGPIPNDERVLAKACGDATRWGRVRVSVLARFTLTPAGWRNETLDEVLGESTRRAQNQANYRQRRNNNTDNARDNKTGNANGNKADNKPAYPDPDPVVQRAKNALCTARESELGDRAGRLLANYAQWYQQLRHGAILRLLRNSIEFQDACDLCAHWDDARLEKLARIVLTTNDEFIAGTERNFKIFATKATWADDRLRQEEERLRHAESGAA